MFLMQDVLAYYVNFQSKKKSVNVTEIIKLKLSKLEKQTFVYFTFFNFLKLWLFFFVQKQR